MMVGLMLSVSGCTTMWNHNRVKQNMVKDRIVTSGTQEQKIAVARGVKPTTALAIIPTPDAKGAYIALDWFALPGFMDTLSEAPASTVGAIVIDAALVGLATYAITQAGNSSSGSGGSGEQNTTTSGTGNSSVNVHTGDNSPVTINGQNGDTATTP